LAFEAQAAAARGNIIQAVELLNEAFDKLATHPRDSFDLVIELEEDRVHLRRARAALQDGQAITLPDHWNPRQSTPRRRRVPPTSPQQQNRQRRKDRRQEQPRPQREPTDERAPEDPEPRTSPEAARALDLAEEYLAMGSHTQARRQVDRVRSLIATGPHDVRATSLAQRLESLERDLTPAPATSEVIPGSPSASVHPIPGGLPSLGRRR